MAFSALQLREFERKNACCYLLRRTSLGFSDAKYQ